MTLLHKQEKGLILPLYKAGLHHIKRVKIQMIATEAQSFSLLTTPVA
jgi:hypothetical protein